MIIFCFSLFPLWQDVFDLPFHMARDQIEESLRTKMTSIKVGARLRLSASYNCFFSIDTCFHYFMVIISDDNQARMTQLQDAQKGAEVTSEATDRELELEAQLVEARSIIQEQVCAFYVLFILSE